MRMWRGVLAGLLLLSSPAMASDAATAPRFVAAEPVWPAALLKETNVLVRFEATFAAASATAAVLRVTGSNVYRIRLNGRYVGYGPARGPKGFFRVDEWPLGALAATGENRLTIDVASYNCESYYLMKQPPFLLAEVVSGGRALAKTAVHGGDFTAVRLPRVSRTARYSVQRTFCEAYRLGEDVRPSPLPLARTVDVRLLDRIASYPDFCLHRIAGPVSAASVAIDSTRPFRRCDALESGVDAVRTKFRPDELEVDLRRLVQQLRVSGRGPASAQTVTRLDAGRSVRFDAGLDDCGFIGLTVKTDGPARLLLLFDETLTDGEINPLRNSCCNAVEWRFARAGTYAVETFEPYVMKVADVCCLDGSLLVSDFHIRTYKSPDFGNRAFSTDDPELRRIFEAARESLAQNAVDVLTDCAGRERAGWLCDSFFSARAAHLLSGDTRLERLFLENYALPEAFDWLPRNMVPMCYPADHGDGVFIPNWAMWLVLEVEEYLSRSGDRALVDRLKGRLLGIESYFRDYVNGDGLLENLPGVVFVDASRANGLTQGVNYPSNMLWAKALDSLSRLYGLPALAKRATEMRRTILGQSWNGTWFCDNAVRAADGRLVSSGEKTEVCQYYAFFCGVATAASHPGLWRTLVEDFGPARRATGRHPDVQSTNSFIGYQLRLEVLSRAGLSARVIRDLKGYYADMAAKTGTLWEYDSERCSLSHGLQSHVVTFLFRDAQAATNVVRVSDCGFDPEDATAAIQAAIDSGAARVVLDRQARPWVSGPLRLRSNLELVFEDGAELVAKAGAFLGLHDCLLTASCVTNVTVRGLGARGGVVRMRKGDYMARPYRKSEFRHALVLSRVAGFRTENMTYADSGGDGIYIDGKATDVVIRGCTCDGNYRQGISVIEAKDLLIEDCTFRNTRGTSPAAGIDFEPNAADEAFVNCVVRNCLAENNQGNGFHVAYHLARREHAPVSLTFDGCRSKGNAAGLYVCASGHEPITNGVQGTVLFTNCVSEADGIGIDVCGKPGSSFRLVFADCTIRDARANDYSADVALREPRSFRVEPNDGIAFDRLRICRRTARPWLRAGIRGLSATPVTNITGQVEVVTDGRLPERIRLDAAWCARNFPVHSSGFPPPSLGAPSVFGRVVAHDAQPGAMRPLTPLVLFCADGIAYAFWVAQPMTVRFRSRRIRNPWNGPAHGEEAEVSSLRDGAKTRIVVPEFESGEFAYEARHAGLHVLRVPSLAHKFLLEAANVPVALDVTQDSKWVMSADGKPYSLFFAAPGNVGFAVLACGEGLANRLSMRLLDPAGRERGDAPDVFDWTALSVSADGAARGLWRLDCGPAARGGFGFHNVGLGGIPGYLFLDAGRHWSFRAPPAAAVVRYAGPTRREGHTLIPDLTVAGTEAFMWSDGERPHADADYVIEKATGSWGAGVGGDTTARYAFPGRSLALVDSQLWFNLYVRSLTVDDLRIDCRSRLTLDQRNWEGAFDCSTQHLRGASWRVDGELALLHLRRRGLLSLEASLVGSGTVRYGGWCDDDDAAASGGPDVPLVGDHSRFAGRFVFESPFARSANARVAFSVSRPEALGGALPSLRPDAVTLGDFCGLKAVSTMRLAAPNRGIQLGTNAFVEVSAGKTLLLEAPVRLLGGFAKRGAGALALAGNVDLGPDGAAQPDGTNSALRVEAGVLRPVSNVGLSQLDVTMADGTALVLEARPRESDMARAGFRPRSFKVIGDTLSVRIVGKGETAEPTVVCTLPRAEAEAVLPKLSVVRIGADGVRRPCALARRDAGGGRVRLVARPADISGTGGR